jgi:hypothetical protein
MYVQVCSTGQSGALHSPWDFPSRRDPLGVWPDVGPFKPEAATTNTRDFNSLDIQRNDLASPIESILQ